MPPRAKIRTPFAERLARIRLAKGITQRELSRLTGISQRVIALYETKIKNPTPDLLVRLARVLKVSVDELMGLKAFREKGLLLKNKGLIKKMKVLDNLPPSVQKRIVGLIDDVSGKRRTTEKDTSQ